MAEYNIDNPLMFLSGTVSATNITKRYEYDDESGLGPSGSNIGIEFEMTISSIGTQLIGSDQTRTGGSRQYDAIDVKTGDWIVNNTGTKCLQIISISSKTSSEVTLVAKDIDAFTYKNYRANQFSTNEAAGIFEISDSGKALIGGEDAAGFFADKTAIDLIQSRFALQEEDERYKLEFSSPQTAIEVGQIVTIDNNGDLIPFGAANAVDYKLGMVAGMSYGNTIVYIKPFNTIIDNFPKPQNLAGSAGDIYYASVSSPGDITTNVNDGLDKVYFQFKDAIPTVITATAVNLATQAGDSLVINGVTAVSGARTTSEIIGDINGGTANHNVVATGPTTDVSLESWSNGTPSSGGDIFFIISVDGGANNTNPSISISDGVNSTTVTFTTTIPYPGFATYLVAGAAQMATDLNTAFQANGLNLTAESFVSGNEATPASFESLRINAASGYSISISNETGDTQGWVFTGVNAMNATANASTDVILTLTRADGGDILLTGTGGFVNTNGMVSSSAGSPALLMMIEDEEGAGTPTVGVATEDDLDQVPNVTSSDGAATGVFISHTPFGDGLVQVTVNGLASNLGDGVTTASCYFSADGGTTARAMADIEGGDQLYWNGSIAGYELDGSDLVDVIYDKPSA